MNAFSNDVVRFGSHRVGPGAPVLFLPDIGTFFNRDIAVAFDLVERLARAGVEVIKGELLHTPEICLDDDTTVSFSARDGSQVTERYRELIERKVVSLDEYASVFEYAKSMGMEVVLSVYDQEGLHFACDIGVAAIKIATSNITHQPLIAWAAKTGRPLIVDTGDSTLEEIDRAIGWAREAGCNSLLVEHSPYPPPASVDRHDLRFMLTLGSTFGVPYGLSDHHAGDEMLYAAVAVGASLVEKGVCPDSVEVEQDVAHALPVSQVAEVLHKCEQVRRGMGNPTRDVDRGRLTKSSRMGLITARDVMSGEPVNLESVRFAFPVKGIPVEQWKQVDGWKFATEVASGTPLTWAHVKP